MPKGIDDQELIDFICWDRRILLVPENVASPFREVILFYPSLADRNFAAFTRQKVIADAKQAGVLSETELIKEAILAEAWTSEKESIFQKSDERINDLETLITKEVAPIKKRRLEKDLKILRGDLATIKSQRFSITVASYDYLAHEQFVLYLVYALSYDLAGERLWKSEGDFYHGKKEYPELIGWLANQIVEEGALSVADIRRVARSGIWRVVWSSSKDSLESLFCRPAANLTGNQKYLIYWSKIYDSIYEDPEQPEQNLIEDDAALDAWLIKRNEERAERRLNVGKTSPIAGKRTATDDHDEAGIILDGYYSEDCSCGAGKTKKKGLGEASPHAVNCRFGLFIAYTQAEKDELAGQIYNKNSKMMRQHMSKEQDVVESKGLVEEQHLRKGKSRLLIGSNQKVHARKR